MSEVYEAVLVSKRKVSGRESGVSGRMGSVSGGKGDESRHESSRGANVFGHASAPKRRNSEKR